MIIKEMYYIIALILLITAAAISIAIQRIRYQNKLDEIKIGAMERAKEQESMIFRQARLASIGELTSGIVHQWKQPLNNLMLLVANIQDSYQNGEDVESIPELCSDAKGYIRMMATTADDFRNILRPVETKGSFDLSEVIYFALHLNNERIMQDHLSTRVEVEGNSVIYGFRNPFLQVVLNLIGNAIDAIVAKRVEGGHINMRLVEKKEFIHMIITDNGGGIPEEHMKSIFNPHFTTKKEKGTGIGLYVCRRIVEDVFYGRIAASNTEEGAQFDLAISKYGGQEDE